MVYMLLGTGFEETEAVTPLDLLRRADVEIQTVGLQGKLITGSHGIPVAADITIEEADPEKMEMIILPGGMKGVDSIRSSEASMALIRKAYEKGCYIAAICAAPTILAGLGICNGKHATCFPSQAVHMANALMQEDATVTDGKLITGASAGCAVPFGLALITALKGTETAEAIRKQIVIR